MPALPSQVYDALARGWTVLTANQRAARTLRREFDLYNRALGRESWQPPAILTWDAWGVSLWQRLLVEGHASTLLLSRTQEHTVWRAVIQADPRNSRGDVSLRPVDAIAETAAEAWRLLHAYRGLPRLRAAVETFDAKTFERWANAFQQQCRNRDYLPEAQLAEALGAAIAAGSLGRGGGLLLVGFDAKTPAQIALLDQFEEAGGEIAEVESRPAAEQTLVAASDKSVELATAARWLRAYLAEHPAARIGVIVPSLEDERWEIDRVFRWILAPELEDITAPANTGPFEFSLGVPLAATPMVRTAFDILRWAIGPLALERISALLLSAHFATTPVAGAELLARAEFDASVLRRQRMLRPEVTLDGLLQLVSSAATPALGHHLRALRALFRGKPFTGGDRSHSEWAASMHEALVAAGWGTPAQLDSTEFQTMRKWESALDELATLDFDGRRVSYEAALDALERIATATLFAPESRLAPIQIMGPLESAGSNFDAVWFLRASDLVWPATPSPNPLLPWHLQRELGVPGTDPARDARSARRTTERIAASAPTVLFSYAEESAEGRQRASPALAGLALELHRAEEIVAPEVLRVPISLESVADDAPIPPPPDQVLPGGASILQAQAACGFRAFAEKRLFSTALEATGLGLDPVERGSIVHDALERFWEEVQSQVGLMLMPDGARDRLLAGCIDLALEGHRNKVASPWDLTYLDTERRRLLRLLRPWLKYEERARTAFTVKSREETLKDVVIGPLRLSVRVDRIDQTADGEVILDYKTGPARPSDWLGDRPAQPQLPLYAVLSEAKRLAAVAFAQVRAGDDMGMTGYEATKGTLPKAAKFEAASLNAQVEQWRRVLTVLAEEYFQGDARVAPKQYPTTCLYCKQRLLCRLDPARLNDYDPDAFDVDPEPGVLEAASPEAQRG